MVHWSSWSDDYGSKGDTSSENTVSLGPERKSTIKPNFNPYSMKNPMHDGLSEGDSMSCDDTILNESETPSLKSA